MSDEDLDQSDWDRIMHALSQFTHNPEFAATLSKVRRLRGAGRDAP